MNPFIIILFYILDQVIQFFYNHHIKLFYNYKKQIMYLNLLNYNFYLNNADL